MYINPASNISTVVKVGRRYLEKGIPKVIRGTLRSSLMLVITGLVLKKILSIKSGSFKSCSFLPARLSTFLDYSVESTKGLWITFKISKVFSFIFRIPQEYTDYICLVARDLVGKIRQEKEVNVLRLVNAQLIETSKQFDETKQSLETKLQTAEASLRSSEANNAALKELLGIVQENKDRLDNLVGRTKTITGSEAEAPQSLDSSLISALSSELKAKLGELLDIEAKIAKQKEVCATAEAVARIALSLTAKKIEDSTDELSTTVNDLKRTVEKDRQVVEKKEELSKRSAAIMARLRQTTSAS